MNTEQIMHLLAARDSCSYDASLALEASKALQAAIEALVQERDAQQRAAISAMLERDAARLEVIKLRQAGFTLTSNLVGIVGQVDREGVERLLRESVIDHVMTWRREITPEGKS
jgi:uncharacterized protein YgbK (DUF1537 family)